MFTILEILGSLGVFLFGMKVLSEGIQKVAGQRMRKIMATMTGNRLSGVGTGFLTTCLLQSSSATTVIVVSFVNAGLLTLVESIGVVMGANLGTTLTAWIIAAVGKFPIADIALPIIGIGLPFLFIGKNKAKALGEVMIGFGLLFFGLGLLKDAVPDVKGMLADQAMAEQARAVQAQISSLSGYGYGSLLIFLAIGVVLTLIVQSSSAAMAITVTLALNGWIGFEESAAIVLGENIGTTVTAWLASLGANVHARRAARAHFMFNILGVLWMLAVFYAFAPVVLKLGDLLPDSFRTAKHNSDIGFDLAIFHTLFNFLNICILIGFVPLIAKIVTKWVKDDGANEQHGPRLKYISQNMLNMGELNLSAAEEAVRRLAGHTKEMFAGFASVFGSPDEDLSKQVSRLKEMEDEADVLTQDITEYLVRCSSEEIGVQNAGSVASMLRIVSELEEVSDTVYRLIIYTQRKYRKKREFSEEMVDDIQELAAKVGATIDFYQDHLFTKFTASQLAQAEADVDKIKSLSKKLNKAAVRRMKADGNQVKTELLNIEINNSLDKVGDHSISVIRSTYYIANPDDIPEKYWLDDIVMNEIGVDDSDSDEAKPEA
ncbi:Na/Pi cotransporter family protein [Verrucomicrobiales bacterium]|nr:Na/Pi cotransporter family protein [Verrucomicrobiales bacterium]MDC0291848.1 Na/Pi cotransporter family protein [Verrucomicrobiales bacterium]